MSGRAHRLRLADIANALQTIGGHCTEFAKCSVAEFFFEHAFTALSCAQKIFRELQDHEMIASTVPSKTSGYAITTSTDTGKPLSSTLRHVAS
jgi:hypothetical protein